METSPDFQDIFRLLFIVMLEESMRNNIDQLSWAGRCICLNPRSLSTTSFFASRIRLYRFRLFCQLEMAPFCPFFDRCIKIKIFPRQETRLLSYPFPQQQGRRYEAATLVYQGRKSLPQPFLPENTDE